MRVAKYFITVYYFSEQKHFYKFFLYNVQTSFWTKIRGLRVSWTARGHAVEVRTKERKHAREKEVTRDCSMTNARQPTTAMCCGQSAHGHRSRLTFHPLPEILGCFASRDYRYVAYEREKRERQRERGRDIKKRENKKEKRKQRNTAESSLMGRSWIASIVTVRWHLCFAKRNRPTGLRLRGCFSTVHHRNFM